MKLPDMYDRQVEAWVQRCFGRTVEAPPVELNIVHPVPERRLDDGTIVLPSGNEIIVGITGELGARKWSDIAISPPDTSKVVWYRGSGNVPALYSLGALPQGRTDIWVDDDVESGLQLLVQSEFVPQQAFEGIRLRFREMSTGNSFFAPLMDVGTQAVLLRARGREVELVGFETPKCVPVTIKWRYGSQDEWTTEGIGIIEDDAAEQIAVDLLCKLLKDQRTMILIDAGAFGATLSLPGTAQEQSGRVAMSRRWRERVKWILTTAPRHVVLAPAEFANTHPSDQELLGQLLTVRPWPAELEPHVRALVHEWHQSTSHQLGNQRPDKSL